MKRRRTALWLAGGLLLAAAAIVTWGLFWPASWAGRLLSGTGLELEGEPTVFPAAHIAPASAALDLPALDSDLPGTTATFRGLLNGWCMAYGSDPGHPDGVEYYAGTLRVEIQSQEHAGYCIDLARTLETGDIYQARVRVPGGTDLCPVYWILETYSHERPGPGLTGREEGAAIQAAIWHYLDGFQPQWDPGCWCYKQVVYDRVAEIIAAASGHCPLLPDTLSLTAQPEVVLVGEAAALLATLTDHNGQPLVGRPTFFRTEIGELSPVEGTTDAQGQVHGQVRSDRAGTGRVTAIAAGTFPFGVVMPLDFAKQPVLIQNPTPYLALDTQPLTWIKGSYEAQPAQRVFLPLCRR